MSEAAGVTRDTFICRHCDAVKPVFYDWRRCYECNLLAATRGTHTFPTVCPDCCRRNHAKPTHSK